MKEGIHMKKTEIIEIILFCTRQAYLVTFLDKIKIIKLLEYCDVEHPLTNNFECTLLRVATHHKFVKLIYILLDMTLNKDGKERIERLMKIGYLSKDSIDSLN